MAATQHMQQHRIGLGEPRLDAEQQACRHHHGAQKRAAPRHEGERRPVGEQDRADRAEQGRHAIEPDGRTRLRHADRFGGAHHAGLQPIDADRFLVADLVLKADVDVVAALDHLLGRLREARFVAVDRRDVEEARQERDEADDDQQRDGARVRRGRLREQRADVPRQRFGRKPRDHVPEPAEIRADTSADPEKWKPVFAKGSCTSGESAASQRFANAFGLLGYRLSGTQAGSSGRYSHSQVCSRCAPGSLSGRAPARVVLRLEASGDIRRCTDARSWQVRLPVPCCLRGARRRSRRFHSRHALPFVLRGKQVLARPLAQTLAAGEQVGRMAETVMLTLRGTLAASVSELL